MSDVPGSVPVVAARRRAARLRTGQFEAVLEAVPDAITVRGRDGALVFANLAAAKMAGFETAAELLAAAPAEILARWQLSDEGGRPMNIEDLPWRVVVRDERAASRLVRYRAGDGGEEHWVVVSATPMADPRGRLTRVISAFHDVTREMLAEIELAHLAVRENARAAQLDAVILAMRAGLVVCDAVGRVALANPAARESFPGVEEQTYAWVLEQLEDPDGIAPRLGESGGPVELRSAEETERWTEISTYPIRNQSGAGDDTLITLRDVTLARERQAVRDTFVGILSHELRTPVTTIYAGAKVLARDSSTLSEEARQGIFEDIHSEAERLHRLVEDVVALTRFGEGYADIGDEPVLLQRLLPAVVRSEQGRWPGVHFDLSLPLDLPPVGADPTYVEQVVRNLLANGAKYGGFDTTVEVTAEPSDDEVCVRILDDGPGFPADEAERLFELFYRSPSTAASAGGAGIGLFVCHRLITAMKGRIWALPRLTGGAEFGFALRVVGDEG
ncbi:MAG: PAS domain-containing sensor histidine kinase [Candidatus Limnocylindrales bacterium]